MITKNTTTSSDSGEILLGSMTSSTDFKVTLKDTRILIDSIINLYKDPFNAVLREITSNGLDSVQEKIAKLSGKVPLAKWDDPNWFDRENNLVTVDLARGTNFNTNSVLIIKDAGVGISPDKLAELFSVFGESSKNSSNLEIGGFGFGGKSPFSLTDRFFINSAVSGHAYLYELVRYTETGMPGWKIVSVEETKLMNYCEVIIPTAVHGIYPGADRIFHDIPGLIITDYGSRKSINLFKDETPTFEKDGCTLYAANRYGMQGVYISLNGILYSIDRKLKHISRTVLIKAAVGDFRTTPTRETLIEDDFQLEKIQNIITATEEAYMKILRKDLAKLTERNRLRLCAYAWNSRESDTFLQTELKKIGKFDGIRHLYVTPVWGQADTYWGDSFQHALQKINIGLPLDKLVTAVNEVFDSNIIVHPTYIKLRKINKTAIPGKVFIRANSEFSEELLDLFDYWYVSGKNYAIPKRTTTPTPKVASKSSTLDAIPLRPEYTLIQGKRKKRRVLRYHDTKEFIHIKDFKDTDEVLNGAILLFKCIFGKWSSDIVNIVYGDVSKLEVYDNVEILSVNESDIPKMLRAYYEHHINWYAIENSTSIYESGVQIYIRTTESSKFISGIPDYLKSIKSPEYKVIKEKLSKRLEEIKTDLNKLKEKYAIS